ncbi:MAG: hypothetical protein ACSHXY_11965 [Alphaproteobacteria bacterium]
MPDRITYSQYDKRWAQERMGGSGATMKAEGCLVTATSMALTNLGYSVDPGLLNARLKEQGGYTKSGQLVWSGISRVTQGQFKARFHTEVSAEIIQSCLADGYYPIARFILPSGRTHWSLIIRQTGKGYFMRDPLHPSRKPLLFAKGVDGFKAIRCVGRG